MSRGMRIAIAVLVLGSFSMSASAEAQTPEALVDEFARTWNAHDKPIGPRHGIITMVATKQNGGWKITALQNTNRPPTTTSAMMGSSTS